MGNIWPYTLPIQCLDSFLSAQTWFQKKHRCRADKEIALAAVRGRGRQLRHAAAALRCDAEVVLAAVLSDPTAVEFAGGSVSSNYKLGRFFF